MEARDPVAIGWLKVEKRVSFLRSVVSLRLLCHLLAVISMTSAATTGATVARGGVGVTCGGASSAGTAMVAYAGAAACSVAGMSAPPAPQEDMEEENCLLVAQYELQRRAAASSEAPSTLAAPDEPASPAKLEPQGRFLCKWRCGPAMPMHKAHRFPS